MAREPHLYELFASAPERECLFAGKLDPLLERNAPHIVRLYEGSALMQAWQQEGWGKNWGILCTAATSLKEVRRFFRHFLQAKLPNGQIVLFRFYDPRVWRTYFPTCTAGELARWFTMVDEYRAETESGTGTLRYTFDGSELQIKS